MAARWGGYTFFKPWTPLESSWIPSVSKIMFTNSLIRNCWILRHWQPLVGFLHRRNCIQTLRKSWVSPWRISISAKWLEDLFCKGAPHISSQMRQMTVVLWPLRKETSRTCLILCRENMAYHNSSGRLLKISRTDIVCSSMILDDIKQHAWKHWFNSYTYARDGWWNICFEPQLGSSWDFPVSWLENPSLGDYPISTIYNP